MHVAHAQAAAHVAHKAVGEAHDAVGDAAVEHQFAGEDEERDGQEAEHLHPADHLLEDDRDRQAGAMMVATDDRPIANATGTPSSSSSVKLTPKTVSSMLAPRRFRAPAR